MTRLTSMSSTQLFASWPTLWRHRLVVSATGLVPAALSVYYCYCCHYFSHLFHIVLFNCYSAIRPVSRKCAIKPTVSVSVIDSRLSVMQWLADQPLPIALLWLVIKVVPLSFAAASENVSLSAIFSGSCRWLQLFAFTGLASVVSRRIFICIRGLSCSGQ